MFTEESTSGFPPSLRIHSVETRGMVRESENSLEAGDVITLGLDGGAGIPPHRAECLVVDCRIQEEPGVGGGQPGSHLVTVAFCGISPAAYQYLQHLKTESQASADPSGTQGHHDFPSRYLPMPSLSIRTIRHSDNISAPDAR